MNDDAFQPREKSIYRYHNGEKVVAADPLVLRGKLTMAALQRGKTMAGIIESANKVDLAEATEIELSEAWSALDLLNDIAIEAFALVPFNPDTGSGADMAHGIGVVDHFYLWCEKKNQTPDVPQTSSASSESTIQTSTHQIQATSSV